jgi:hypothetical protein
MGLFDFIKDAIAGTKKTAGTLAEGMAKSRDTNTTFNMFTGERKPVVRDIKGGGKYANDPVPGLIEEQPVVVDGKPVDPVLLKEFIGLWGEGRKIGDGKEFLKNLPPEGPKMFKDFYDQLRYFLKNGQLPGSQPPVDPKWLQGVERRDINAPRY